MRGRVGLSCARIRTTERYRLGHGEVNLLFVHGAEQVSGEERPESSAIKKGGGGARHEKKRGLEKSRLVCKSMLGSTAVVLGAIKSRDECNIWAFRTAKKKKRSTMEGRPTHFDRSAVRFPAEDAWVALRASCRKRETEDKITL